MTAPLDRVLQALDAAGCGTKRVGRSHAARCPAHNDRTPSLTVDVGKTQPVVLNCHAGCSSDDILSAIGLSWSDVCAPNGDGPRDLGPAIATYVYTDEAGRPLFRVVRYDNKEFRQHAWLAGSWDYKLGDARRVLYRLPEVLAAVAAAEDVWLCEGEKDADRMRAEGVTATCNPMGAGRGKWKPEFTAVLAGTKVSVVADRDLEGWKHALQVVTALEAAGTDVAVFEAAVGKDASDHFAAGHGLDDFVLVSLDELRARISPAADPAPDRAGQLNDPLPDEPLTEYGYARRLIHVYGDRLRHVIAWKRWLVWDGQRWMPDGTGQAARWMKVIARQITTDALGIVDEKERRKALAEAKRGESSAGVAGALTLASTEKEMAVAPEDLDVDPFLLNCRNGTLDLRTGTLRPHDPKDMITKVTGADYRPDAAGVEFFRFLARIQPDEAMRQFLGRLLGHTLEGRQVVHVLPIFHGAGANGKGTLTTAVLSALGDYAAPADPELLTARTFDAHPTGVADLFGLRLAVLHEGDAGRHLAEGTVKRLTGGDRIKARRMREDFWWFDPSHTFVMLTNHKPLVAGTDEGIWRRLRLVPFDIVIPAADRDEDLGDRLALESDAVLAWLVAGYQEWHSRGLDEPPAVMNATDEYRRESDAIGRFLDERCTLSPDRRAPSAQLFGEWSRWCIGEGMEAGTNKAFTTELQKRGLDTKRTNQGAVFQGVGIATDRDRSDAER